MKKIEWYGGNSVPLELHKVRIVQKLTLLPVEERQKAMENAGYNTFLLNNRDVFLDMLTDSGVNAMSDLQQSAMLRADDSYAGSATFTRLKEKIEEVFDMKYFLPAHQGRACENIISRAFVRPGTFVPMNYHFTTTKAHIDANGGKVVELIIPEGLEIDSDYPFKGNLDTVALEKLIREEGADKIAFVRMEAGTNLIGGQPFSMANLKEVRAICDRYGILFVLDASLLQDNLYFIKAREEEYKNTSIADITKEISSMIDILYFSARKLGFARGGGICGRDEALISSMREYVTMYEGFLTYGGMSVREMEAMVVGLEETMDEDIISQAPQFIAYMVEELKKNGIPVVTPGGGLGCHVDAMRFLDHVPQSQYPAGALTAAIFIAGGVRGMERGTLSEARDEEGNETFSNMELVRLALPRRVFTLSQVRYTIDRLRWLYENRSLIGGLRFIEEPKIMRFFFGRLEPTTDWPMQLVRKFREDFGDSL